MPTIELNTKQLRLIQTALELYGRIAIFQFDHILYHDVIDTILSNQFRPKKDKLEVGDGTERGEITKITKKYIYTKGSWGNGEEIRKWSDIENVKLSIDYVQYHEAEDQIKSLFNQIEAIITQNNNFLRTGYSYGVGRLQGTTSGDEAYDMMQVIRHEFWKHSKNPTPHTVDSNVMQFSTEPLIKVTL